MENNDLNIRVYEKLQKKIAMNEFIESEKITEKKAIRSYAGITTKVASILMLFGLVGGNIYTFAVHNENIFSYTLKKIGILQEYDENKKTVNAVSKYDGTTLEVVDYVIDSDNLIMRYKLVLSNPEKDIDINFTENAKIRDNLSSYDISNSFRNYVGISKISDTEYEIYRIYDVNSSVLTNDNIYFMNDVVIYKANNSSDVLGEWNFNFKIDKNNMDSKEYDVNCENIVLNNVSNTYFKIASVKKSKLATKIRLIANQVYMDYTGKYTVEILDENGNIILEDNQEYAVDEAKTYADIIIGNTVLTSKVKLIIYEKDENDNILSQGYTVIDLENDLTLKTENEKDNNIENNRF